MLLQEIIQNVNFSLVGSTDLKPMDIKDAVVKEKLSFLLLSEFKKNELPPILEFSTLSRSSEEKTRYGIEEVKWGIKRGDNQYELILDIPYYPYFRQIDSDPNKHGDYLTVPPIFHSIRSNASFEEISLFDATRKEEPISDSDRIIDLLEKYEIADDDVYAKFKTGKTFKPQKFTTRIPGPQKNACIEKFVRFQRELGKWFKGGFPRRYYRSDLYFVDDNIPANRVCWTNPKIKDLNSDFPSPIFYKPLGPMAYDVQPLHKYEEMRLQRFFFNPDMCGLRETLVPTIFIHDKFKQYPVMTGLPNREVPLWNAKRIIKEKTDTVIICGCIQDAEALQRYNATMNENVIFTGFVGDNLDLVDFSPLNGKNVVFLISNHNGMSLAEAYFEADKVYQYLCKKTQTKAKAQKKFIIPEFAFVQRQVKYPDSSTIGTPEDLASAYYHNRPTIVPESTFPKFPLMDESDFAAMLAKIRKSPTDCSLFSKKAKGTKEKKIYPVDECLIRSLLYRGETTLLSGFRGSGKSRFCQTLIRYIVNGDDTQFLKERFWTRCCKKSHIKIVYWNYDGVGKRELEKWKQKCLKGLPTEKRKNIIIENSPRLEKGFHKKSKEPILEPYKNRIEKYALTKGTPEHPVDLLIVDTLARVWKREKIVESLEFLADLATSLPNMAILAIHHTDDCGKPRGGDSVEDIPRVSLIFRKLHTKAESDISASEDKELEFFEMWYHKNNKVGLDIEKKPFYCVRENIDQFTVIKPACTREEMFEVLRRHYKIGEGESYEAIGELLGCSEKTARTRKLIDTETYNAIKDKVEINSPPVPQKGRQMWKSNRQDEFDPGGCS